MRLWCHYPSNVRYMNTELCHGNWGAQNIGCGSIGFRRKSLIIVINVFSIRRFVHVGVFCIQLFSSRRFLLFWRLVLVDVFYFSTFCPSWRFFQSTFCPVRRFFHSTFCPIRRSFFRRFVHGHFLLSAFFTSTFCWWTVFTHSAVIRPNFLIVCPRLKKRSEDTASERAFSCCLPLFHTKFSWN
jgi:hypothetical protein